MIHIYFSLTHNFKILSHIFANIKTLLDNNFILQEAKRIKSRERRPADKWQHETDYTVSQDDSINLVHS